MEPHSAPPPQGSSSGAACAGGAAPPMANAAMPAPTHTGNRQRLTGQPYSRHRGRTRAAHTRGWGYGARVLRRVLRQERYLLAEHWPGSPAGLQLLYRLGGSR
ncbi:MAG: hypothetical protein QOJ13_2407 [Gaiellales bacterium]|nr:hypothetical protein [Gaiellales bacterium]